MCFLCDSTPMLNFQLAKHNLQELGLLNWSQSIGSVKTICVVTWMDHLLRGFIFRHAMSSFSLYSLWFLQGQPEFKLWWLGYTMRIHLLGPSKQVTQYYPSNLLLHPCRKLGMTLKNTKGLQISYLIQCWKESLSSIWSTQWTISKHANLSCYSVQWPCKLQRARFFSNIPSPLYVACKEKRLLPCYRTSHSKKPLLKVSRN